MERRFVCHYGEIALKGENRSFFEKKLLFALREALPGSKIISPRGRIVITTSIDDAKERLKKIPGIDYFFEAEIVESSVGVIEEKILTLLQKKEFNTFRVTVKRSDKSFPVPSPEFASSLGSSIVNNTQKKVDLFSPELTIYVEINRENSYIYFNKIKGVSGIPVSSSGKAVALISGGIDSPVASFCMMKRGLKIVFVHFHSYPSTSKQSIEKVEELVKKLSAFQGRSILYLVPFNNIQKEIMINTKEKLRVLLYRRFMMRIAERVAKKEKAKALVSGESLGQVASQTIENIQVTGEVVGMPVFRPLIGSNKEEIISIARKIDTYETSILPEEDCCVRFLPQKPEVKGKSLEVKQEEDILNGEELIEKALEEAERKEVF